jgi:hypothetical protein
MSAADTNKDAVAIRYGRYEAAFRVREAIKAKLQVDVAHGRELYRSRWWAPFVRAAALAHRDLVALSAAETEAARHARTSPAY